MAVGYVPEWVSLLDAIQHIERVAGGTRKEACDALLIPLREGAVLSRVRGQALIRGNGIHPERWYLATVFCDGSVTFADDPRFPHLRHPLGLGPLRHQIEVRRNNVVKCWPAVGEPPATRPAAPRPATSATTSRTELRRFVVELIAAGSPNKVALWQKWTAASHRGSRDALFQEFNRQMEQKGFLAPGRGRPRKSPK